jgi:hypothetical protein
MTSPSLLRRLEAAENAFLGAPIGALVAPDPGDTAEVGAFNEKLLHLKANHHRQIIIVDTGIRRGELT